MLSEKCSSIKLINRHNVLQLEDSSEHGRALESVGTIPTSDVVECRKSVYVPKIKH